MCGPKAERSGFKAHGTNRSGNVGAGATLGSMAGRRWGFAGWSAGLPELLSARPQGVRSAQYWGLLAGTQATSAWQEYAAFAERCLKEKGYETEGAMIRSAWV